MLTEKKFGRSCARRFEELDKQSLSTRNEEAEGIEFDHKRIMDRLKDTQEFETDDEVNFDRDADALETDGESFNYRTKTEDDLCIGSNQIELADIKPHLLKSS